MHAVPTISFDPMASTDALVEDITRWVCSEPIDALIRAFDGPAADETPDIAGRLDALASFSEIWDFRRGAERNLSRAADIDDELARLVNESAVALQMVNTLAPRYKTYDHVVVLGGLIRACICRPRHAAELLRGGLQTTTVTGIGAFRPLGGDEPELAAAAGLFGLATELDAMVAGMAAALDLGKPDETVGHDDALNPNLSWKVMVHRPAGGPLVRVVAAPTTDPDRRANTPDSYKYLAEDLVNITRGDRVLAITSAIYVPFQHADAIRMLGLPYGAEVDTVGLDMSTPREPALTQSFTPANQLQEVRSAILATRNLYLAAVESG